MKGEAIENYIPRIGGYKNQIANKKLSPLYGEIKTEKIGAWNIHSFKRFAFMEKIYCFGSVWLDLSVGCVISMITWKNEPKNVKFRKIRKNASVENH